MEKLFQLESSIELVKEGKCYDLHNQFDFAGLMFRPDGHRLQVYFLPNAEYGEGQVAVSIVLDDIDYLEFSPNFGASATDGLNEVGFKSPLDRDHDWLMGEKHFSSNDHIFIGFDGGAFIRAHCRLVDLVNLDATVVAFLQPAED